MKALSLSLWLAALVTLAAGAGRAEDAGGPDPWTLHGGVGVATLVVPSLHLQLEGRSWFVGAEYGFGYGGWGPGHLGLSALALVKAGRIWESSGHPYLAIGAGWGSAYDLDNLSGSGFALTAEAGLMLGYGRSWGRVVPFIELPIATWSIHDRRSTTTWSPGVGFPLVGIKLLL
jgi:hypothetical protein